VITHGYALLPGSLNSLTTMVYEIAVVCVGNVEYIPAQVCGNTVWGSHF
jgi:hypothetical protein